MQRDIRKQIHREIEIFFYNCGIDRRGVRASRCTERAADEINCLVDLLRRAALRSLRKQARDHRSRSGFPVWIGRRSRLRQQKLDRHRGLGRGRIGLGNDEHAQAVRQRLRCERWEMERAGRRERGHLAYKARARSLRCWRLRMRGACLSGRGNWRGRLLRCDRDRARQKDRSQGGHGPAKGAAENQGRGHYWLPPAAPAGG